MHVQISIVNAFTRDSRGGNPAAVVLNADNLSTAQKQQVATLAGLSETAFISRSAIADFTFDFFTPVKQIAHCGHATVAAFVYLKQTGKLKQDTTASSKETIDGRREIIFKGAEVFMEQKAPVFKDISKEDEVVVAASLGKTTLKHNPVIADAGNRFLLIEADQQEDLTEFVPDMQQVRAYCETWGLIGFYIHSNKSTSDATTRMFAPAYGFRKSQQPAWLQGRLQHTCINSGFKSNSTTSNRDIL